LGSRNNRDKESNYENVNKRNRPHCIISLRFMKIAYNY